MLPDGWGLEALENVAEIRTGIAVGRPELREPVEVPYLRVANVQDGRLDLSVIKTIRIERSQIDRYRLRSGDVLMTEGGDFDKLGRGDVWRGQIEQCIHQNHVFCVRPEQSRLHPEFLAALSSSAYGKAYFLGCAKRSTNLASINSSQLRRFPVLLPPLSEQKVIARVLFSWDKSLETTGKLLASSELQHKGLMQQLLFGRRRYRKFIKSTEQMASRYGLFPKDWRFVRMSEIASEAGQRNLSGGIAPVLVCSKYKGFVDSLQYFNKRVFSEDLSAYKVIRRHEFGFPSNHVEEGSIGYQDIADIGLVSPIYTVFSVSDDVVGSYLYRLFKSDRYRQIFAANTNASVDRRGSLRWNEFKNIQIALPPIDEQVKIAAAIDTAHREVENLRAQLSRLNSEKQALMQQIFSGRRRVFFDAAP